MLSVFRCLVITLRRMAYAVGMLLGFWRSEGSKEVFYIVLYFAQRGPCFA